MRAKKIMSMRFILYISHVKPLAYMLTLCKTSLKYVVFTTFVFSVLCLFVGNWTPSNNFCMASPWKYVGPMQQTFQYSQPPSSVVGPMGSVIMWIIVTGFFLLFVSCFFGGVCIIVPDHSLDIKYTSFAAVHALLYSAWAVYGMVLFFGTTIPETCINYDHGNNLAYILLGFMAYYNLALVPVILFTVTRLYWSRHC